MDALAEPHQSSATASLCSSWPKAALTPVVAAQQPYSGSAKRPGRLSANHHEGGPGKKTQQRLERDVRCHSTRERALSLAAVLFSPHPKLVVMQPRVRRQGHNGTSYVGLWLVVRAKPLCHVPDGFWRGSLTIPTSLKQ